MRLRAGPCARPPSLVDRTSRSLPLVESITGESGPERPAPAARHRAPTVLQLARSGFDELQVLGQERRAVSRMRVPLTRHERMFASVRPHPDCPRSSRSSKGPQKTALESQRPRRSEAFVQCRRRDSSRRHADHDSHLIWLNHREFWALGHTVGHIRAFGCTPFRVSRCVKSRAAITPTRAVPRQSRARGPAHADRPARSRPRYSTDQSPVRAPGWGPGGRQVQILSPRFAQVPRIRLQTAGCGPLSVSLSRGSVSALYRGDSGSVPGPRSRHRDICGTRVPKTTSRPGGSGRAVPRARGPVAALCARRVTRPGSGSGARERGRASPGRGCGRAGLDRDRGRESSPGTWCRRAARMVVGEVVGCSGRLELEDLLIGVAMGPLLEERPHRGGG
jgi:hypothetical protein